MKSITPLLQQNAKMEHYLLGILLVFVGLSANAQNYCFSNDHTLGGSKDDVPISIIQISDGYVICGWTNSNDGDFNVQTNHHKDGFIAKFDFNHQLIWRHTYGGTANDEFWSIQPAHDEGFIIGGNTSSRNGDVSGNHGGTSDVWVVKLDALGLMQWQHCYGGNGTDYLYSINLVPEGYAIAAESKSNKNGDVPARHGDADAWLLIISPTGNIIDTFCYGGSDVDYMISYTRNNNGTSTFLAGTKSNDGQVSRNNGNGTFDSWLVNIDDISGNIKWQKCFGTSGVEFTHTLSRTTDDNIVICGASPELGLGAAYLIKVNPETGIVIWDSTYSKPDLGIGSLGSLATSDGGVLSMGAIGTPGNDITHDAYVFKVNSNGVLQWEIRFGGSQSDNVPHWFSGIEVGNEYIVPVGTNSSDDDVLNAHGGTDAWIVTLGVCGDQ